MSTRAERMRFPVGHPDAWAGFTGFVRRLAQMQLADRGFTATATAAA
jgi:hypothetical protein